MQNCWEKAAKLKAVAWRCSEVSFLIKLLAEALQPSQKESPAQVFPLNFTKFVRTYFMQKATWRLLLKKKRGLNRHQSAKYEKCIKILTKGDCPLMLIIALKVYGRGVLANILKLKNNTTNYIHNEITNVFWMTLPILMQRTEHFDELQQNECPQVVLKKERKKQPSSHRTSLKNYLIALETSETL